MAGTGTIPSSPKRAHCVATRDTERRVGRSLQPGQNATPTGRLPSAGKKVYKGHEGWLVCTEVLTTTDCFREKWVIADVPYSQFYCTADPNTCKRLKTLFHFASPPSSQPDTSLLETTWRKMTNNA